MLKSILTGLVFLLNFSAYAAEPDVFQGLVIKAEEESDSYDRDDWEHWTDEDDDEEDTRVEVLIQESLIPAVVEERSGERRVVSGLWVGKYTGQVFTTPSGLHIDHMVPLKEAHESGGHEWDDEKRKEYSNDLEQVEALIAVKGGANSSKRDKDPAKWLPPNRSYWCEYLNDWIAVKQKWKLTVDAEEVEALKTGLSVCSEYRSGDHLNGRH